MSYFIGGPLDQQQREVDGYPLVYRCRVREPMPSCALAEYMEKYPIAKPLPLHTYRLNVHGNYVYEGIA